LLTVAHKHAREPNSAGRIAWFLGYRLSRSLKGLGDLIALQRQSDGKRLNSIVAPSHRLKLGELLLGLVKLAVLGQEIDVSLESLNARISKLNRRPKVR
jgi:hypothetical protein